MPGPPGRPGAARVRRAGASCCAWRISTPGAAGRNTRRRYSRTWPGSGWNGNSRYCASRSISTATAPPWRRSAIWASPIPASAPGRTSAARSRRPGSAPHGPPGNAPESAGGFRYPGTCRGLAPAERQARIERGDAHAWRLDTAAALARFGRLIWRDEEVGNVVADPASFGDVVLARKDTPASYHLSVTLDDARQGVTLVVRGTDLFAATPYPSPAPGGPRPADAALPSSSAIAG